MKIAYFIPHLREASGMNKVLCIKADYLANVLNHDVTVITYRQHSSPVFFPFSDKVKVVHFDIDDPTFRLETLSFLEKRKQLKRFMHHYKTLTEEFLFANDFDICISLFLGAEYKFLHQIKDKSKKILEFHLNFNSSPFRMLNQSFQLSDIRALFQVRQVRKACSEYDRIVVLTKDDAEIWKKHFSNIMVIGNPVTIDAGNRKPLLKNKTVIAVGRLEKEKGFDYLIDAWKTVHKKYPDWTLNIFGQGNLECDLQTQIEVSNLEQAVFLRKPVSDIAEKYLESSIFVLSSRHEGFVLVLIEAMAVGLPPVSFDCNYGPAELIDDGKNGFLVTLGNTDQLAAQIIRLIEDENLRHTFSQNAVKATEKFSLPKIMTEWEQLFRTLVKA